MSIVSAVAFEQLCVPIAESQLALPRQYVAQAAHHAGYAVTNTSVDAALRQTERSHYMTAEEFDQFCTGNQSAFVAPEALAHAIVVIAPSNVITRASLEAVLQRHSSSNSNGGGATAASDTLSADEVDALFAVLDTSCSGAITGDDVMRAFRGDAGVRTLQQVRRREVAEARAREQAAAEAAARAQREAAAREQELQRQREAEQRAAAEREAAARAQQAQRDEAERQRREATAARAKKTKTCC